MRASLVKHLLQTYIAITRNELATQEGMASRGQQLLTKIELEEIFASEGLPADSFPITGDTKTDRAIQKNATNTIGVILVAEKLKIELSQEPGKASNEKLQTVIQTLRKEGACNEVIQVLSKVLELEELDSSDDRTKEQGEVLLTEVADLCMKINPETLQLFTGH